MSDLAFLPDKPRNAALRDAYAIADKRVPQLAWAVQEWARNMRAGINREELLTAVRRQEIDRAVAAIAISPIESPYRALAARTQSVGRLLMNAAGQDALDRAQVDARFKVAKALDFTSETARRYLRERAAQLVTELSVSQREMLRSILAEFYDAQVRPEQAVDQIMDLVGLTSRDANAATKRYFAAIEAGASVDQAKKVAGRYAKQALRRRAMTIARTETTDAQAEAQTVAWREAAEAGELPSSTQQEWGAADHSPRLSDICRQLDATTVQLGQPFYSEVLGRYVDRPPAHPNCRSVLILRF